MNLIPGPGAAMDAALAVRYTRFMDETFGPGNWERRDGEPEHNETLRMGMFLAFKAGAARDD
jgi:hypothetical protein